MLTINKLLQCYNANKKSLNLSDQKLEDEDINILCEFLDHYAIISLDLNSNKLGPNGAKKLAENNTVMNLDLSYNFIGAIGAKYLAANKKLVHLDVSYNQIKDEGAIAFATNKTLSTLDVQFNHIGPLGAKALAANRSLSVLDMSHNDIGGIGAKYFAKNTNLLTLDTHYNHISDDVTHTIENTIAKNAEHDSKRVLKNFANEIRVIGQMHQVNLPKDILMEIADYVIENTPEFKKSK